MKNIEKYLNDLVKLDCTNVGVVDDIVKPCTEINCKDCEIKCSYASFYKWLASE